MGTGMIPVPRGDASEIQGTGGQKGVKDQKGREGKGQGPVEDQEGETGPVSKWKRYF